MVMELRAKEQNAAAPVRHANLFTVSIRTLTILLEVLEQASGVKGTSSSTNGAASVDRQAKQSE